MLAIPSADRKLHELDMRILALLFAEIAHLLNRLCQTDLAFNRDVLPNLLFHPYLEDQPVVN